MPPTARVGYRFVAAWVGACVLGGLLNLGLQLSALPEVYRVIGFSATPSTGLNDGLLFERLLDGALFAGFTVGLPAFVLGRRLCNIELPWLVATVAFAVVAYLASFAVENQLAFAAGVIVPSFAGSWSPAFPLFAFPFVVGGFSGLFIGLGQAIVLARYLRFAAWWIAATGFAFGLSAGLVTITDWLIAGAGTRVIGPNDYLAVLLAGAVSPLVIGLVTGLALMRLLSSERVPLQTRFEGQPQA